MRSIVYEFRGQNSVKGEGYNARENKNNNNIY
jgi:hypothetical protein